MKKTIWVGYDPREHSAFAVAQSSFIRHWTTPMKVRAVMLRSLEKAALYDRPYEKRGNQLWDLKSDAPMSTEFACSRFFTPILAKEGWALFTDCDVLVRDNPNKLFDEIADPKYAVMCVKHKHNPASTSKMHDQIQTQYARKNWSSVMLFNCDHPSNTKITLELLNSVPGRDLHRFCWLEDHEIGEIPPHWNYLVGHSELPEGEMPSIVHFTNGLPYMPGYEDTEFAEEWWRELERVIHA